MFFPEIAHDSVEKGKVGILQLFGITLQLGILLLLLRIFNLEEDFGLLTLIPLIFGGFIVHALLPIRFRMPFFLLLSFSAICILIGVTKGVGLIIVGLGFVAVCHLPVSLIVRVILLLAAACILAVVRIGIVEVPWAFVPSLLIPLLGALFMFRIIIYLYDLNHEKKPASWSERLSYFFMLPNVCFLLFPVVDYQTFRRTWYDAPAADIYQKGLLWIFRGITHLLLYRVIYYYLLPAPAEVTSLSTVLQWMVTTYLLYLRISGQFHMIAGLMGLFGFNLPETNHLYYLASNINDYWRRINIYWKDFMLKIIYYPVFMRARKWGMKTGQVVATILVFAATWFLHSYQWFWLQGIFPMSSRDIVFWGVLGGMVVWNTIRPSKKAKKNTQWSTSEAFIYSLKVLGMFSFITILWSYWNSQSFREWLSILAQIGNSSGAEVLMVMLILMGILGIGVLLQFVSYKQWNLGLPGGQYSFFQSAIAVSIGGIVLLLAGQPQVQEVLGEEQGEWIASIQQAKLNEQDAARLEQGYYEGLLSADNYASALRLSNTSVPDDWITIRQAELSRNTQNMLEYELVPSYEGEFLRSSYQANQWGMRDQEYSQEKPAGTYRIALLGASYEMGSGVDNEAIFEAVLEKELNAKHISDLHQNYEVLNFSVNGYSAIQQVYVTQEKVLSFQPDLVLLTAHSADHRRLKEYVRRLIRRGRDIPYPELAKILDEAGIEEDMVQSEIERRLAPVLDKVVAWSYNKIAEICNANGIQMAWVLVPMTNEIEKMTNEGHVADLKRMAENAGFTTINLFGAFENNVQVDLMVAPWDGHPNALGHELLANRLYTELTKSERLFVPRAQETHDGSPQAVSSDNAVSTP